MDTEISRDEQLEKTKEQISDRIKIISGALYRVTDLLSDKEPLKWTLRTKSVRIHESLMSVIFSNNAVVDKNYILNDLFSQLSQMVNILELAGAGSYISNLNFEVLKKEYLSLKSFLEGNKESIFETRGLLSEFLGLNLLESARISNEKDFGALPAKEPLFIGQNNQNISNGQTMPLSVSGKRENSGLEGRKQKIFTFIKSYGSKTISEITPLFDDISEKSIQRDLLELVKIGKIQAEGEKRWRKYKLATNSL